MAGMLAAIVVLAAGAGYILTRHKDWSATTTVVLAPSKSLGATTSASYWDTLSNGTLTSTVGSLLSQGVYKQEAAQRLGLTPAQESGTSISAASVTGTLLVRLTATAATAQVATSMAGEVVSVATRAVDSYMSPYEMSAVSSSGASESSSKSLSSTKFVIVLFVVAIALGIGVQQGALQLLVTIRRRREGVAYDGAAPEAHPNGR